VTPAEVVVATVVAVAVVAVAVDDPSARSLSRIVPQDGPGASASGPPAPGAVPEGVRRTDLDNGLRIVSEEVPGARSASVGVWVGVGSRDEPPALAGVSHALEHLLFKGTDTRSARGIAEAIDAVGGEMNAFTSKERTAFYAHLPAAEALRGIDILADVLTRPALRPEDVESECQVILEEIALDDDDPEEQSHRLSHLAFYGDHPLGREVAGTAETVLALGADDIRSFFDRWYQPANLVVAAAGVVDHDLLVERFGNAFADKDGGDRPKRTPPPQPAAALRQLAMPVEQVHLTIGMAAPDAHDPQRYVASVLNQVLGGSVSSRLFQRIREERGLVYSVYSMRGAYSDAGSMVVSAGTSPDNLDAVRGLVEAELDDLAEHGVTAHELSLAQGYLCGATVLGLEDPSSRMARLAGAVQLDDEVTSVDEVLGRIRAVTLDEVAACAATLGSAPRLSTVVGAVRG
jgi:predicted Zn-dependent peptidase